MDTNIAGDQAIEDAIYLLNEARNSTGDYRRSELVNAQEAIEEALK